MPESPYKPYDGDLTENKDMRQAYEQYAQSLQAVENGTFPVKKGSFVFRVINGLRVGSHSANLKVSEIAEKTYATPHTASVLNIMGNNDLDQMLYDGSPYDTYQRVAVIQVDDFEIPKPDSTHTYADRDQVVVTGSVEEILTPNDFISKYVTEEY